MSDRSLKQLPAMLAILAMTGLGWCAGAGQEGPPSAGTGGGPAGSGPAGSDPAGSDPAVGHIQDGSVRCSELRWFVEEASPKIRRRPATEPEEPWRRRMVGELVLSQRLAARGQAAGGDRDPVLLKRWNRTRDRLLLAALERDLSSGIEVGSEEIERRYREHRERFSRPETITTQLILLRLPPDADAGAVRAAEQRLRAIREQHLAGTPFGELARRHSQAENAARGGIVASSPRGTLLAEFEEAAWKLEPGEVSDVVRLPDGVALILLNKRLPARQRSLDEARGSIENTLRRAKVRRRSEQALAKVCSPWPPELGGELTGASVLLHLAGEAVRLQDLDADRHRPRWREQLESTLETLCRRRLAAERGIERRPEIADKLRYQRQSLLAAYAMDRQLEARAPEVPEERLKALYEQHRHRFEIPPRRTFEVAVVAGAENRLRPARAQAQAVARRWRDGTSSVCPPPGEPTGTCSRELWGPMPQTALAALTSPILARRAFALEPGEVSEPLRLEHYEMERSRFATDGYAVLKLRIAEPRTFESFEDARERLLRHAARAEFQQLSAQIRRQVLLEAGLRIDPEALAACPLAVPPTAKASAGPAAGGEPGR